MQDTFDTYRAWLQIRGKDTAATFQLVEEDQQLEVAYRECRQGMQRLYGAQIWNDRSDQTICLRLNTGLPEEGYRIASENGNITIEGCGASGVLYGVFAFLLHLGSGGSMHDIHLESAPAVRFRVLNHWDNLDGTIERGYAGRSIFFRNDALCYDENRIRDYARLLASVGINVIAINNVNVTPQSMRLITPSLLPDVAKLAELFRPYGIRIALSVHFDAPVQLGGHTTSDPCNPQAAAWWETTMGEIYRHVPDFAGVVVKADSEFQAGPKQLGRTQAAGANMLAKAIAPYGGVVFWRCFMYNCLQDWRDIATDRPMSAYQEFFPLDGDFADNVILQIKHGPVDFQVREPNSPLLGAMKHTRQALELQITQEYTGQQIDLYNLAVQWQEALEQHICEHRRLRDLMGREIGAVCAVANVGDDTNWTGHLLAQQNLFAFGRMSWCADCTAEQIAAEWIALTFGENEPLLQGLTQMMMRSREIYENYTAPLGIGFMVNVGHHYGPSVEGYEFSKWGTYHRASHHAIGVDRTSSGTGYTQQYDTYLTNIYDDIQRCPQKLLLFFHRLPYTHRLRNGKTLIQHIYDTHYEGVQGVEWLLETWETLRYLLPDAAYTAVKQRLELQHINAREWRDQINTYFYRKTGIPDQYNRKIYG